MQDAYSPVPELNLLKEFDDGTDEFYAAWDGLDAYGDNAFLKTAELVHRVIPFALANGSGSLYALWRLDDRDDLATVPVLLLGDEGGTQIVARHLREFFQLLGCLDEELECYPDGFGVGFRDITEPLAARDAYLAWLDRTFGLPPASDPAGLIEAAQAELGPLFAPWAHTHLNGDVYSPVHELNLLQKFEDEPPEDRCHTDKYAHGFGLLVAFGEADAGPGLISFGLANGSDGSLCALRRVDDRTDLASLPVVLVGEDGGQHELADDLRGFLRLLASLDGALHCDREGVTLRECDPGARHEEYIAWLVEHLGLTPAPRSRWDHHTRRSRT